MEHSNALYKKEPRIPLIFKISGNVAKSRRRFGAVSAFRGGGFFLLGCLLNKKLLRLVSLRRKRSIHDSAGRQCVRPPKAVCRGPSVFLRIKAWLEVGIPVNIVNNY